MRSERCGEAHVLPIKQADHIEASPPSQAWCNKTDQCDITSVIRQLHEVFLRQQKTLLMMQSGCGIMARHCQQGNVMKVKSRQRGDLRANKAISLW